MGQALPQYFHHSLSIIIPTLVHIYAHSPAINIMHSTYWQQNTKKPDKRCASFVIVRMNLLLCSEDIYNLMIIFIWLSKWTFHAQRLTEDTNFHTFIYVTLLSTKWFKLGKMFTVPLSIFVSQLKFHLNDFSISWSSRISLSPSCSEVSECSASKMQQYILKSLDWDDNNGVLWLLCSLHVSIHLPHSSVTVSSSYLNPWNGWPQRNSWPSICHL